MTCAEGLHFSALHTGGSGLLTHGTHAQRGLWQLLCLSVCVCLSVCEHTSSGMVQFYTQTKVELQCRLFLIFNSWIFAKLFHLEVMA